MGLGWVEGRVVTVTSDITYFGNPCKHTYRKTPMRKSKEHTFMDPYFDNVVHHSKTN